MIRSDIWINNVLPFEPFHKDQINPNSYDIRLGAIITEQICISRNPIKSFFQKLRWIKPEPIILKGNNKFHTINTNCEKGFTLYPNRLYIGVTAEKVISHDETAWMVKAKSSIGRIGMSICKCAGFGDTGFSGYVTLELAVEVPVTIFAGQKVGQIVFFKTTTVSKDYNERGGQYSNDNPNPISSSHKNI